MASRARNQAWNWSIVLLLAKVTARGYLPAWDTAELVEVFPAQRAARATIAAAEFAAKAEKLFQSDRLTPCCRSRWPRC